MTAENSPGLAVPDVYEVVSAVGNHEVKGLVLASMQPEVPYTMTPLYHELMTLQGPDPVWNVNKNGPHEFCKTFTNVGLVAEETVGANAAIAFRITERGQKLARPLVGHLLDLSITKDPPLVGFFGPTQTSSVEGIRPSERHIGMMRHLLDVEGKPSSMADVSDALGIKIAHAGQIATDMAAFNILSRQSSGRGKPTIRFEATPGFQDVTVRQDVGTPLLFDVLDVLKDFYKERPDGSITNSEIARILQDRGSHTDQSLSELTAKVSNKTHNFVRPRNILRAKRDMGDDKSRETVSATDDQLETMEKAVSIIDGIQKPSETYLEDGQRKLDTIRSQPELVNHLMLKAKNNSSGRKGSRSNQVAIRSSIGTMLANSAGPQSIGEVREQLLAAGQNLDRVSVYNHLKALVKLGHAAVSETTEGFKFTMAEPIE
ncbi:MAG TPA: hypothetical protein VK978_00980 [Candidatus Saccharimonadales bacterium]|nr:hypothetical protein [Candidatus Saccharimonadales bacterium]